MKKIICDNPVIEHSNHNQRVLAALFRSGFATRSGPNKFIVDWEIILQQRTIRDIGKSSWKKIEQWAKMSRPTPNAPDLPETWAENEHPTACIYRQACIFYKPANR